MAVCDVDIVYRKSLLAYTCYSNAAECSFEEHTFLAVMGIIIAGGNDIFRTPLFYSK